MKLRHHAAIGLVALACLAPGCGESSPATAPPGTPPTAVTDNRLQFKDEYRKALSKDGRLVMRPGMMIRKKAAATPKP